VSKAGAGRVLSAPVAQLVEGVAVRLYDDVYELEEVDTHNCE